MLMNNIGMLNDNLDVQRQIMNDKNDIYSGGQRGGPKKDFNGRIIQDFDNQRGGRGQRAQRGHAHGFDPNVYGANGKAIEDPIDQLEKAYQNNKRGGRSPHTQHAPKYSRRKENRRTGHTPNDVRDEYNNDASKYNSNTSTKMSRQEDDFGMGGGHRKARTQNLGSYNSNFDDNVDPFGNGDGHMMKKSRGSRNNGFGGNDEPNPFAKGDNRMMGGGNTSKPQRGNNRQSEYDSGRGGNNKYDQYGSDSRQQPQQSKPQRKATRRDNQNNRIGGRNGGRKDPVRQDSQQEGRGNFPPTNQRNQRGGGRPKPRMQEQNYGSNNNEDGDERGIGDEGRNDDIMYEAQNAQNIRMAECQNCGRKFGAERLSKHQKACKIANRKRKKFDTTAMRNGDDSEKLQLAKEAKRALAKEKKTKKLAAKKRGGFPANKKGKDWLKQSEAFRAQIRAARGGKVSAKDEAVIKEVANAGMVECKHCNRTFGKKAADRHIPVCRDKMKNTANRMGGGRKPTRRLNARKSRY